MYAPPICSFPTNSRTDSLSSRNLFILGDFNCHHTFWDSKGTSNPRGEEVFDRVIYSDVFFLNDLDIPTRLHCSSGGRFSPYISLASFSLAVSSSWEVLKDLGFDHLPILLTVSLSPVLSPNERPPSFNFQKACGDDFAFCFDSHCPFCRGILLSFLCCCSLYFSDTECGQIFHSFWPHHTPTQSLAEVEEAVGERRKAFAAAHISDEYRQPYISVSRHALSAIAKAKAEAWQATCSSLSPKLNPKSVYSFLRSVAGLSSSSSSSPDVPQLFLS